MIMNEALKQAVSERVQLGYTKETVVEELKAAGYDDATIETVYQSVTGPAPATHIPAPTATKKLVSPWLIAFAPILFLIALIVVWGIVNLFTQGSDSNVLAAINNLVIPFLLGLSFLAFPICIIVALVVAHNRYDGTIRCGNCSYNGMGESGRSLWAQILVWLAFFVFWPITLIYYLVTHRYRCPQCKSTFVGMRDKTGAYHAPSGGLGVVGIVIISVVVIAIIGILAALVLGSLNDAREAAQAAADRQLENSRQIDVPRIEIPQ